MKKSLIVVLVLCIFMVMLSACGEAAVKSLTAEDVVKFFTDAKLPVGTAIVYTEETDPNKFLGRPNQYIFKANFADTRIEQLDETNPKGGSIEIFTNKKDMEARKKYLEKTFESMPALTEYLLVNKTYLLRLNKELTTEQVEQYRETFMSLK